MENKNYYIAIDLGAESGRVIVGTLKNQKLLMKEIHRFPTKQIVENETIYWDINFIYSEMLEGIKRASAMGYNEPSGIGIDSWAVDFGLLDEKDELIELPIAYRDKRTNGMMERVFEVISKNEIYKSTGIQFLKFNSIFQLYSLVENRPEMLVKAKSFLMIPDLLNFFLTGNKFNEYTNTTTTSMLDAKRKEIAEEIIKKLRIPSELMQRIIFPSSKIGMIKEEIAKNLGIKGTDVIAVGSHDTASAIVAIPVEKSNWAYLSSGTWSLLGIEINEPILTENAREYSFTNEGGVNNTIRFLKNIMGLWLLQRARLSWSKAEEDLDYSTITSLAEKEKPFQAFVNPDDERFFNPKDMIKEIENYFSDTNQQVITGIDALGRVILESLAFKVAYYFKQLSSFTDEPIEVLHIVGGGSQNELLNQFIANACNVKVVAGPTEGTAAGNIMTQALAKGDVQSLSEIRKYIRNSYDIIDYFPKNNKEWEVNYKLFVDTCKLPLGD